MRLLAVRDMNEQDPLPGLGGTKPGVAVPVVKPPPKFTPLPGNADILVGPDGKFETRIGKNEAAKFEPLGFNNPLTPPHDFYKQMVDEFHKLYEQAFEPAPRRAVVTSDQPLLTREMEQDGWRLWNAGESTENELAVSGKWIAAMLRNGEIRVELPQNLNWSAKGPNLPYQVVAWCQHGSRPPRYEGGKTLTTPPWMRDLTPLHGGELSAKKCDEFVDRLESMRSKPAEAWIPWEGGKCPVPLETRVAVRFACGSENALHTAGSWDWKQYKYSIFARHNIIAYRVL